MKKETTENETQNQVNIVEEQAVNKDLQKKKKKNNQPDEEVTAESKTKKSKAAKTEKTKDESKRQKTPKEDKITKFMVSMKKSVRKNIKKEAAEAGISMNEYIVVAIQEKFDKESL